MLDFTPLRFDSLERRAFEPNELEFIRDILRDKGAEWVVESIKLRQRSDEARKARLLKRIKEDRESRESPIYDG